MTDADDADDSGFIDRAKSVGVEVLGTAVDVVLDAL
ncbi:hypothetical protein SAMN06265347_11914 [Halobellus salinus]|nr:hypothetical protein SAMN06265347_11914 [Halobellus salinus]